jgi:primosomal protein N''
LYYLDYDKRIREMAKDKKLKDNQINDLLANREKGE